MNVHDGNNFFFVYMDVNIKFLEKMYRIRLHVAFFPRIKQRPNGLFFF